MNAHSDMTDITTQIRRLDTLLGMLRPVPSEWLKTQGAITKPVSTEEMECRHCHSYSAVVNAWRKAMKWTDMLDCSLSVMFATAFSTPFVGEQLWVKIIGPAASGKTTLVEGLAVNKKYVLSKDTIRGFYSGTVLKEGEEDLSIAALGRGKTLATKDGDGLLRAPNRDQILAEGRGLYDGAGRTHYRNRAMPEYERHRMTWLLCGTRALRDIDDSELGVRFLDCVLMDSMDDEFEEAVGNRASIQEARNMLLEADGTLASAYPPELAEAMMLTGGYVDYLRENGARLTATVKVPMQCHQQFHTFGLFTAYMRARPPKKGSSEDDDVEREFSPRLTKQFTRLGLSLAVVLNRREIDDQVMARVRKVCMDTSRGVTMNILKEMLKNPRGVTPTGLSHRLPPTEEKLTKLLRFLKQIGVCETVDYTTNGVVTSKRWRLTAKLRKLYEEIGADA